MNLFQKWRRSACDAFEIDIRRDPQNRRPDATLSPEAFQHLASDMSHFVGARLLSRLDRGKPADQIRVRVIVEDLE